MLAPQSVILLPSSVIGNNNAKLGLPHFSAYIL